MSTVELVLSERPAPDVRLITMNRPDRLNAMSTDLCQALHDELPRLRRRPLVPGHRPHGRRPRVLRWARPRRLR